MRGASAFAISPNWVVVVLAMCVAAGLGVFMLDDKSIWLDEAFSISMTKVEPALQWDLMSHREANQAPYFLLLDAWAHVFGDGAFALRSLSVILAVASIPLIYAIGSRLFGTKVGLIASCLLPFNAFFIEYAQEVRGYALILLMGSASSYLFIRLVLEHSSRRLWLAYALMSAAAVYAHFFFAFVILGHVLSLAFLPRRAVPLREIVMSLALIGILLLPLGVYATRVTEPNPLDWIREPGIREYLRVFTRFSGGREVVGVYFILAGITILVAARTLLQSRRSEETWRFAFVFCWLLTGPTLAFAVSLLIRPILEIRYFMMCFPALPLLVAFGLSRTGRFLPVAAFAVLAVSMFGLYVWYANYNKEDWRSTTNYVLEQSESGDAILFFSPYVRLAFDYYADRSPDQSNRPTFVHYAFDASQPEADEHPLWRTGGRMADPDPQLSSRLARDYDRVWLILSHDGRNYPPELRRGEQRDELLEIMEQDYQMSKETDFDWIRVLVYERKSNAAAVPAER